MRYKKALTAPTASAAANSAAVILKCRNQCAVRHVLGVVAMAVVTSFMVPRVASAVEVALDVGHSMRRAGATAASGAKEFDLNLALSMDISRRLSILGVGSRLIGSEGMTDILIDRTRAAATDRLFISIHHDSIREEWMPQVHEFSGFALFVSRKNAKVRESLDCARRIGDQLLAAGFKPSRYHAIPVPGENRPFADESRGIHFFDDLVVLKTATQPAVLVEAGVIVNPADEMRVTGPQGRPRIAQAIANELKACLSPT